MRSTDHTLNIILVSFLLLMLILVGGVGRGKESVKAVLDRRIFALPSSAAAEILAQVERNTFVSEPNISAAAALVLDITADTELFARAADSRRPIASLTKLLTAAVALDHADINDAVRVSQNAVSRDGNAGGLHIGETLSVEALIHAMLLESSNDAAAALAEHISSTTESHVFVSLINEKAVSLGLQNSYFSDPTGLNDTESFSTAADVSRLAEYLRETPDYQHIWEILSKKEASFQSLDGQITHNFITNNSLIGEISGIIGGKTGYTDLAGGSLVLVIASPDGTRELVYVVLGSPDRFGDVKNLINWVSSAYLWK